MHASAIGRTWQGMQILANRGPDLRFVVEANTKALISKLNSSWVKKLMDWGRVSNTQLFWVLCNFLFVLFEYIMHHAAYFRLGSIQLDFTHFGSTACMSRPGPDLFLNIKFLFYFFNIKFLFYLTFKISVPFYGEMWASFSLPILNFKFLLIKPIAVDSTNKRVLHTHIQ